MFCNQCEQTSKGKACTRLGICGKNEAVAIQQDKLVWQLRELAAVALMARDAGIVDTATDDFAFKALFSTLTNVNFDPVSLRAVQEGRIYFLEPHLFHYKPNSRWAESYETLYEILYADDGQ